MQGKITVRTTPKNRITINTKGSIGSNIDTLVKLKDVDATSVDNNETIVFDGSSGKFVVKELPVINGGDF